MNAHITHTIAEHARLLEAVRSELVPAIDQAARAMIDCIEEGGTIYWCGNGGSAADAQHFAAELIGRFERDRRALPSIALNTDTSVLTSIGNDYGFGDIYRRQVEGLVRRGDVLVAISTSGSSPNIVQAVSEATKKGAVTIGLLGRTGGPLRAACTVPIVVPGDNTARIQEMHALIGHILCDLVERAVGQGGRD